MENLTGRQFGPYRIVAPLGEGGMASVYKAYQANMDRFVALKILPSYFARDPQFVARFKQEAKVLARLQHPHILPVHDFGETDGYTYIVMPFVETGSLAELMERGRVPLPEVYRIIAQVGSALDYAHLKGVVHRDVKPSNILIDSQGNCLLTDFGIAKIVEGTTAYTQTGGTLGTPTYMSPEQIRGDKLDGRSDIYSLGVLLYEMATGRPPYRAETPPAIFVKHLHDPLPPPHVYNPEVPEEVERVILKALAKERDDRFKTAGELSAALARGIAGEKGAPLETALAVGPTLPPAPRRLLSTEVVSAPAKTHRLLVPRWAIAIIGTLILAAVIAVVVGAVRDGSGTTEHAAQPSLAARSDETPTAVSGPVSSPEPTRIPTKTPESPTDTAVPELPTSRPTTRPSPASTATVAATHAPTAAPTHTAVPTPTAVPTRTPLPTPKPTLAPAVPPPQVVSLFRWCGTEYTVEAGRRIELRYGGWVARGAEIAEENMNHLTVELSIDGQPVSGYWLAAFPLAELPCGGGAAPDGAYMTLRSATVGPLATGAHPVQVTLVANEQVSDGYDWNGDGQLDLYGPGVLSTWTFTIIVP